MECLAFDLEWDRAIVFFCRHLRNSRRGPLKSFNYDLTTERHMVFVTVPIEHNQTARAHMTRRAIGVAKREERSVSNSFDCVSVWWLIDNEGHTQQQQRQHATNVAHTHTHTIESLLFSSYEAWNHYCHARFEWVSLSHVRTPIR